MAHPTSGPTASTIPAELDPSHTSFSYENSSTLYLFTSLTAGSSHVITATSRLETILKAHRIPFRAIDCATDEKARRIWGRKAGKRQLPGLVREGWILAGMDEVEEWNEDGILKEQLKEAQEANEFERDSERDSAAASPGPGASAQVSSHLANVNLATGPQKTLPIREAPASAGSSATLLVNQQVDSAPSQDFTGGSISQNPAATSSTSTASTTTISKPIDGVQFAKRPTTIAFSHPQDSFTGSIRGGSALATPIDDPITASAGPSTRSGLEAVTSDPEALKREASVAERGRVKLRDVAPGNLADALAGIKPETHPGEKTGGGVPGMSTNGARVKFEEDQLKGDARDGRAAEDSVGD